MPARFRTKGKTCRCSVTSSSSGDSTAGCCNGKLFLSLFGSFTGYVEFGTAFGPTACSGSVSFPMYQSSSGPHSFEFRLDDRGFTSYYDLPLICSDTISTPFGSITSDFRVFGYVVTCGQSEGHNVLTGVFNIGRFVFDPSTGDYLLADLIVPGPVPISGLTLLGCRTLVILGSVDFHFSDYVVNGDWDVVQ